MAKKPLTKTSVIARSSELVCSDIDGEIVMMSIENGNYYGLDEVGSYIWEILEKPVQVSEIIDQLLLNYEVEKASCEKDVMHFLQQLDNDDMLEIK